jgi:hypothetical protein
LPIRSALPAVEPSANIAASGYPRPEAALHFITVCKDIMRHCFSAKNQTNDLPDKVFPSRRIW